MTATISTPASENLHSRKANSIAIAFWNFAQKERRASLFIPLAILSALALVSYAPQDPSLNTATFAAESIHNWLGKGGAILADLLIQMLGKAAWGITAVLVSLAIPSDKTTLARTACFSISLILAAVTAALLNPEATNNYPAGGGGILGEIFRNATYTNNPNLQKTTLIVSCIAAIALFLAATPNLPQAALDAVTTILKSIRNATLLATQTAQALAQTLRNEQPILLRTPLATQSPSPPPQHKASPRVNIRHETPQPTEPNLPPPRTERRTRTRLATPTRRIRQLARRLARQLSQL